MTHTLARRTDPQTSKDAAARVHEFSDSQQYTIFSALSLYGPMGAEEIGDEVAIHAYAVRKRLAELHQLNRIKPTGDTRRTRSGRSERIWQLCARDE